jgi:hypothetical protein
LETPRLGRPAGPQRNRPASAEARRALEQVHHFSLAFWRPIALHGGMTSRKRYLLLAVAGVLVAVALLMHRLPRRWADPVDLYAIRQRIAALEREVDAARSADPTGAYVPRVAGSIADPDAPAIELLKQLPGVARIEGLVTVAKPTHRIIHFRDYHHVSQELYAADLAGAGGPGVVGQGESLSFPSAARPPAE